MRMCFSSLFKQVGKVSEESTLGARFRFRLKATLHVNFKIVTCTDAVEASWVFLGTLVSPDSKTGETLPSVTLNFDMLLTCISHVVK